MNIWLIAVGEPLPLPNNDDRLLRVGILSKILESRNHNITWWTSTVNHFRKKFHFEHDIRINISKHLTLELLHGHLYKTNISLKRFINHIEIARKFRKKITNYDKPDLILCSYPTVELSKHAIIYGQNNGIPVLIDIRDLWPDIFIEVSPKWLKGIMEFGFISYFRDAKFVFKHADAILGVTSGIVEWGLKYGKRYRTSNDRVFPHGYPVTQIDSNVLCQANSKWDSLGVSSEKFIICCFGSITRNKLDLETVLSDAKRIEEVAPNVLFVICGDGDEKEYYSKLAESQRNVIFPGLVNKAEIYSLLQRSDLGIAPIRNRFDYQLSIPNKPIEYLSAGKPVLTPLKGELEELINKHNVGCIYNDSPGSLSTIILSLINNPTMLNQMSNNAYELFENSFHAEKIYNDFADFLEEFMLNWTVNR